jgi:spore maturation protein CgeB
MLKILFVGPLKVGSTTLHRMTALKQLGHSVHGIDTWHAPAAGNPLAVMDRLMVRAYRFGSPIRASYRDWVDANGSILSAYQNRRWDVLWLDKGVTIDPETLREVKTRYGQTRIVGYSPDDMMARHNHSRQFIDGLPHYDAFFTTKSYNVGELKSAGSSAVFFVDNAFDPVTHRPVKVSSEDMRRIGGEVGFVGSYEGARANSIRLLAQSGVAVRIYGDNWQRLKDEKVSGLFIEGKTVIADEYARTICSFDINLHFLRKINRDQQTTRSIEIPACGKPMVAERTQEHLNLFEDGKEAIFFDSDDELLEKTQYYMKHPSICERIGRAGRDRCLRSGYSNQHRLKQMLQTLQTL